jgi:hypothetical protein
MLRSKSKEPKKAINDYSNSTGSDLNKKSTSRLKGMLRSKSKGPKQPNDDVGVETVRAKSRLSLTRSKSRESAGKTDDSNGKEPKSILKKMAFLKKKKGNKEEDVQYYVGRPSTQEEFKYRPVELDYGL